MKKIFVSLLFLLIYLPSLTWASCSGFEDEFRIKHLRISKDDNFYHCLGYMHGLDRAFQLYYFRQVAHGELAESLGFKWVKQDFQMRLLNLYELALKIKFQMSDEDLASYQKYVDGVNAGLRQHKKKPSPEFDVVKMNQAPWRIVDTLMLLLLQSFDQTRKSFVSDIEEENLKTKLKNQTVNLISTDFLPWDTTIIKEGEYIKVNPFERTVKSSSSIDIHLYPQESQTPWAAILGEESGSNSWVISKEKSKSGFAILANDPHLDLKTPMFWYWLHLESVETDLIGASFPGVPVIVSGTNRYVSWGLTNSYIKTAKAYQITVEEKKELVSFRPWVWFKFGPIKLPIFFKTFERLKNGNPIIPLDGMDKMALHWNGFDLKARDLAPLLKVAYVKNVDEMNDVLLNVNVPSWNFVFSDIQGDIGYRVVGRGLKMTEAPPVGIERLKEIKILKAEEMPSLLRPKRNYIITANNRHWPMDHIHHGGRSYSPGFRALRIEQLIKNIDKLSVLDVHVIQTDRMSTDAFFFRDKISDFLKDDLTIASWGDKLIKWNLDSHTNCEICFLYRRTMDLLLENYAGREGIVYKLMRENNLEIKTKTIEIVREILRKDMPRWGNIHQAPFTHLTEIKELNFSPRVPTSGDKQSVDPGSMKWNENRYDHTAGASQRLIVEMRNPPEVFLTLPGLNTRYWEKKPGENPWQEWSEGKLKKIRYPIENWEQEKIEKW